MQSSDKIFCCLQAPKAPSSFCQRPQLCNQASEFNQRRSDIDLVLNLQIGALVAMHYIIGNLVSARGFREIWIVPDVNKDSFAAVIWFDPGVTPLTHGFDAASLSHV